MDYKHISKKVFTGQHYGEIRMVGHFSEVLYTNSCSMANNRRHLRSVCSYRPMISLGSQRPTTNWWDTSHGWCVMTDGYRLSRRTDWEDNGRGRLPFMLESSGNISSSALGRMTSLLRAYGPG